LELLGAAALRTLVASNSHATIEGGIHDTSRET
jgi:hypothetical protein